MSLRANNQQHVSVIDRQTKKTKEGSTLCDSGNGRKVKWS